MSGGEIDILILERRFSEAFDLIYKELEDDPECAEDLRELFVFVLNELCSSLNSTSQELTTLNYYEKALKFYGKDSEILNNLGSFFEKHNKDDEARAIFQQAYDNDNKNLRAYQNLQNVKNKTSRWHFRMLNDTKRNAAFEQAIQYWIGSGAPANFIDIGAGTGLLSLYAAEASFYENIYAIECSPIMSNIARKVLKEAKFSQVKLIEKHSKDVKIGVDMNEKASLIVTETLDCGAFGEGILDTLIHAKKELLKIDGQIVPWKVKIHVAGYQSKSLCTNRILINESFNEYLFLHNFRLIANNGEPYDSAYVEHIPDFRIVTDSVDTLEVNFNDLEDMERCFSGEIVHEFQLQSDISNDYLDGFVTWFTLYLNPSDSANDISTAPLSGSCWNQTLFKLKERVLVEKFQVLKLSISCKNGVLQINHELDNVPGKIDLEVDEEVMIYLNDDEYLREVEFAVSKHKGKFSNCLDLSIFPYVGMVLLKDGRVKRLYCRKDQEDLIRKISDKNLINPSKLFFIEKSEISKELESINFQLIIMHPFHALGDVDDQLICEYNKYSQLLAPNGIIIPKRIKLCGELINSDWLVDSSRVTNSELKKYKIDEFVNELSTELHLDLNSCFEHEKLSDAFEISEIFRDEFFHERVVEVHMKNINLPIQAILFFYKIMLGDEVPEITTNRKEKLTSSFRRIAKVLKNEVFVDGTSVKIHYTQNCGICKCEIEQ